MLKAAHEWYLSAESVSSFLRQKKQKVSYYWMILSYIFWFRKEMDVEGPSQAALEKQTRVLGKHAMQHHVSDVQHGRFLYPKLAEQKTCHVFTDGRNFCIRLVLLVYPIIYIGVFTLTASPFVALQIRAKPLNTFQKIKSRRKKTFWGFRPKKAKSSGTTYWPQKSRPHTKITRKSPQNSKQTSPQHHLHQKFSPNFAGKFWPRDNGWIDWSRIGNVDRPCEDVPHWQHPGAQLKRLSSATLEAGNI